MKKTPKLLVIAGVILLALGLVLKFTGGAPGVDPAARQQCEQTMTANGAGQDLINRCGEATFPIATTATDAESAARGISAANSSEIGGSTLSMFLIGLGLALATGGFLDSRRRTA